MTEEDIRDPRVAPRWLEAGITGLPRSRDWDVVLVVELPELESSGLAEISLDGSGGGVVALDEPGVPDAVLERLAGALEQQVEPPYEAIAVRRGQLDWALAARSRRFEEVALPAIENVDTISVAVAPDGERQVYGLEKAADDDAARRVIDELERRGRERFDAFVVTAEQSASGWKLTIDPL
jgi:hypothetical protein